MNSLKEMPQNNENLISNIRKITDLILSIRKDEKYSEFGLDFDNIQEIINTFEESLEEKDKIIKKLDQFSDKELLEVFAFYYYGRDIVGKAENSWYSYFDKLEDLKGTSRSNILDKLCGVQKNNLKSTFNKAFEKFDEHENSIPKEKEKYKRRQKSFLKKDGNEFFEREENFEKSNSINIQKAFSELNIENTEDIKVAKKVLESIIENTDGLLGVDFLGLGSFDRLAFVEVDDDILKLYWKYSQESSLVHNYRVDIKFDKLKLIQIGKDIRALAIKGFYTDIKWIKNYYNNNEKAKINSFEISKTSVFYYDLDFDKTQRGGKENFIVSFLPWRYYSILVSSFEDKSNSIDFTKILLLINFNEIENRINQTYLEFKESKYNSEDSLSMYGNRYRKILESLLKFVLLASGIMYKENYEKDTLGLLLQQLEDKDTFTRKISLYKDEVLDNIVEFVKKELLDSLNFCSHENVSVKFDKNIIENLHNNMRIVLKMSMYYFK